MDKSEGCGVKQSTDTKKNTESSDVDGKVKKKYLGKTYYFNVLLLKSHSNCAYF